MRIITTIAIGLLLGALVWGQGTTAQINGTVKDASGLAVPGADIKATQTATGAVRNTTSGADGGYVLPNLSIGPYIVEVSKEGFSKYVQSGIVLQVGTNPTIDAAMKIGSVNDQITVEANANLVETHSTTVGTVVDNQRVLEMPLNGRNVTELIFLAGIANQDGNSGFLNNVRNYPTIVISVAGAVGNWTNYLFDGANHNDAYNGMNLPLPFPDAIQEFKIESSALPAQYGVHAGATVNVATKSGTNELHGNAFEFLRNGNLNARDFFAPTRDTLKRNQFGGTVGGRVIKDKLFYFAGWQETVLRSTPTQTSAYVPTPAMLGGDFTTFASAACNGGSAKTLSSAFGFVGNKISPALFSPAALKVAALLPTNATDQCGKTYYGLQSNQKEDMGVTRVDWQKSDKHSMYVRFYVTNLDIPSTFVKGNALTLSSNGQHDRVYAIAFGDTYLFGSSIVSAFRVGANRSEIPKVTDNLATWPQLGVNAPFNPDTEPRFAVSGGNGFGIGGGNAIINHDMGGPDPSVNEDISWVHGAHQFGLGMSYLHTVLNYASGINATGLMTFNGSITGLGMGDFLTGNAITWAQGNVQGYLYNRQTYIGLYAQDSWKATSRLTVNYGVRWEPFLPVSNKYGWFDHFDPALFAQGTHSTIYPLGPAGLIFPGDPQWTPGGHKLAANKYGTLLPRLGVVWDPQGNGKMTIRASYGAFTDRGSLYSESSMAQDSPYGTVIQVPNVKLDNPWATYPGGNPLPLVLSPATTFPAFAAMRSDSLTLNPTWVNQFNLAIQRQVGKDWLLQANYVGNTVSHLIVENQINPALFFGTGPCTLADGKFYSVCSTTANQNQRRLFYVQNPARGGAYGIISLGDDGGTSSYNGLYLSAQKRLSGGMSVLTNFTWSHCIGDLWNGNPGNNGASSVTPLNRKADRGNCSGTDQRKVANISIVATVPKLQNKALRMLASDWQFAPIIKLKSAAFYTASSGTDTALNGEGGQRANYVAGVDPYLSDRNSCTNAPCVSWSNPKAFSAPALGTLGNVSAFSLKGPGVFQLDLSVSRNFRVWEKRTIQFRAEAFNLPNHLNPSTPGSNVNNANSFNITSDISGTSGLSGGDYRVIQFATKFTF